VQAAQDVAALSESARQASTSLQLIQQWGQQANQLNISTDVLNGSISKADGAYRQVVSSGMAQVNALGLEGDARDKATDAINRAGAAAYNNAVAQGQSQQRAAEAADLASAERGGPCRDAEMASQGITAMGVALKNIVHDTTISASEASGKTLGAGVTLTGILSQEGYYRAELAKAATERLDALKQVHANDNFIQTQKGLRDNAASIGSPLAGLVDTLGDNMKSAQDKMTSAQDSVSSAEKAVRESAAQKMENASANDPRLDPYLSRNASVFYGTATEQFYKEISWQDASLNAANQSLSTEQEALQTAQQQLATAQAEYAEAQAQHATLQSIQASANKMASSNMDPAAIGDAVAASLARAGFQKSAADTVAATGEYVDARSQLQLQAQEEMLNRKIAAAKGEGTGYKGMGAMGIPTLGGSAFGAATPFTTIQDIALKPHAAGADLVLPGSGGEQPYVVSARPGERMTIKPDGAAPAGAGVTQINHVYGVTDPNALLGRLEQMAQQAGPPGFSKAATRAARLAA
jgi:hypothetical protein